MHFRKYPIIIDTTHSNSSTGISFYSTDAPNGYLYAVEYIQSTGSYVPSTATLTVYVGSTVRAAVTKSASTSWMIFPRGRFTDTTGSSLVGASSDFVGAPFPLTGDVKLTVSLTGGTSAATTGLVNVYVEGL